MSRDQALGAAIFILCSVIAVGYTLTVAVPTIVKGIMPWLPWTASELQFGAIAGAVLVAFGSVMFMGAWIGWTMATTKPSNLVDQAKISTLDEFEDPKKNK